MAAPDVARVAPTGSPAAPRPEAPAGSRATTPNEDARPLIRADTSQDESDRLDRAYFTCLYDNGSPYKNREARRGVDDEKALARFAKAEKACATKKPEEFNDRLQRKDPGDFADRNREWVKCMKQHGLHIEVDTAGVWGFAGNYAATELGSPWVDKCETEAFAGAEL